MEPAGTFETAFLDPAEFGGSWITGLSDKPAGVSPEILLRKEFELDGEVERARADVSALGYGYLDVNGRAATDNLLDTVFTQDDKTVSYTTYDVTELLRSGENALGVSLGPGMYANPSNNDAGYTPVWRSPTPKLKLELDVRYSDGRSERIASDTTWRAAGGPTTDNSPAKESYDARREQPGWSSPDFEDSSWLPAVPAGAPTGVLRPQRIPPVRRTGTLEPIAVTDPVRNVKVYDFGITTSGRAAITAEGDPARRSTSPTPRSSTAAGTGPSRASARPMRTRSRAAVASHSRRSTAGRPTATSSSRRTTPRRPRRWSSSSPPVSPPRPPSPPPLPEVHDVRGEVVHTALESAGGFRSSSELFERMHVAMRRTTLSNVYSYVMDTSVFEKGGWTNDTYEVFDSAAANFDAQAYFKQQFQTYDDAQNASGNLGWLAPARTETAAIDPLWGGSYVLMRHNAFRRWGDVATLRRD